MLNNQTNKKERNYLSLIIKINIVILIFSIMDIYRFGKDLILLLKFITYAKYNVYLDGELTLFGVRIIENLQHKNSILTTEFFNNYFISFRVTILILLSICLNIVIYLYNKRAIKESK